MRVTYIPRFPDQTPHSAKSDLDLDCLSISHGCIYSYFDLFIAQVVFVRGLIMSEISNAFEHFIALLMKSDSHFLKKAIHVYQLTVHVCTF